MLFIISKLKCVTTRLPVLSDKFRIFERFSSSAPGFVYKFDFTTDQQGYILQTLNESNMEQLARYSLAQHRIKKLEDWRRKNGKFNTLVDVLDVDGLGVRTLDKLCKSIINGENLNDENDVKKKPIKTRGQILTPLMSAFQQRELKSALGIHLYATGISWAKIEKEQNNLVNWDSFEYNLGPKKLSPADALQLVINASSKIPTSDVYVFEAPISVTPTAQQSAISVSAYAQRVQLLSMLITLLSINPKHNPSYLEIQKSKAENKNVIPMENKVFFLRHRLPARLFRTLIGTERVSAATTVGNILSQQEMEKLIHSPLAVDSDLKLMYEMQGPICKEVLGQALLLTMSFMDVCVYHNQHALKVISSNSR